jgi:aspartyl/asparaginyl beta-hydroxylase (cupin superfamily)
VTSHRSTGGTWREGTIDAANMFGGRILHRLDAYLRSRSLVGSAHFFDTARFPWITTLESSWPLVRRELEGVLRHREDLPNFQDIVSHERHLTDDTGWKTYFFMGYGLEFAGNMERCPDTALLLRQIPGLTSAMFSILAPGKRIPPHRGPYAGVLRYHLALAVPEPAEQCGIRVGGEVRNWEEGRSLVFDDVYEHEVWNDTPGTRVVLFVDFKRPLAGLARLLNDCLIGLVARSPYVRDAAARHGDWEKRFEKARTRLA